MQRKLLVGTLRANRKELRKVVKIKKDKVTWFENCFLTVYKSKPNKKVLLLITKYKTITIEKNIKLVPETVTYYNSTKYGVDILDQMARKYGVKASSRRWPLQVVYNILDLAVINAWILYKETTQRNILRKHFIFQLAEELESKCREVCEHFNSNNRNSCY